MLHNEKVRHLLQLLDRFLALNRVTQFIIASLFHSPAAQVLGSKYGVSLEIQTAVKDLN